jgi:ferric-dicitrate binding protein FerR (iron transport regulator)
VVTAALAGCALVALHAAAPETPAVDPAPVPAWWKAVAASGPVETRPGAFEEGWAPVRRGDRLDPLYLVRTGHRGRATLTRNGDILMVDPESQVELPPLTGDESSVVQSSGSVIYEVDRRDGRDFQVVTPYLVAGVKGTIFMVTVTDTYASVTVEEGLVEVTALATGESLDVGAGESVHLDATADGPMEHVSLRAKADRRSDGTNEAARKLARADLRRLGHAVAQRNEIIMDELDPTVGPGEAGAADPGLGELDTRQRNAIEEDLDTRETDLTNEEPSEDLINNRNGKTPADVTETPVSQ